MTIVIDLTYVGPFKKEIEDHIKLKQAIGYKYCTEAGRLKLFDRFIVEKYPKAKQLTKEIVLDWCSKKTYETRANQSSRVSVIREFAKYLDSIGKKSYCIPKGYYPASKRYIPYIYTVDELKRFFAETDKCSYCCECPYRHLNMPLLFRMIYMCGLRLSEARLLKVADVDIKQGILTIHHSKKDKSRLVPMCDSLTKSCRDFSEKVHSIPIEENYYFPGVNGKPITRVNIDKNFRRFLLRAKISHRGRGFGPRVYDFRHTYAVNCLKKWVEQKKDLMVYLPILKTYMGHNSFAETAYYLHLTADVFPDIIVKLEGYYPNIIPTLDGDDSETN